METPIVICLRTARKWLCKLGYENKNICKNIFVDRHKQCDIVKDYKNFFKKIKELKSYIIKFEENKIMKLKIYPFNCIFGRDNYYLIVMITYNKYTFFANSRVQKIWMQKKEIFL